MIRGVAMPMSTIPVREVFIERLMKRYGQSNKNIIDLLIDAKDWYERTQDNEDSPITQEVVISVSMYLRHRYTYIQSAIEEELKDYNKRVKLDRKKNKLKSNHNED